MTNVPWMGIPLPLTLGFGCSILIAPGVFLPGTASPQGLLAFPIAIPPNPAFVGALVYAQGGTLTPSNTPALTNALAVTIG